MRLHLRAVVDQAATLLLLHDLEGKRGIEHHRIDVARQHVRNQPAAPQRHGRELHLAVLHGPAPQHVGGGAGSGDADLLALELGNLADLAIGLHHQVPAVVAERGAGHGLGLHTLSASGGDEGGGVELQVGGAGRHRLEGLRAAAVDRQLRLDALLGEEPLAQRRFGDDGGIVGLGRQPDADRLLRAGGTCSGKAQSHCSGAKRVSARGFPFQHVQHSCFLPSRPTLAAGFPTRQGSSWD